MAARTSERLGFLCVNRTNATKRASSGAKAIARALLVLARSHFWLRTDQFVNIWDGTTLEFLIVNVVGVSAMVAILQPAFSFQEFPPISRRRDALAGRMFLERTSCLSNTVMKGRQNGF